MNNVNKRSSISQAKTDAEIAEFWETHNPADYIKESSPIKAQVQLTKKRSRNETIKSPAIHFEITSSHIIETIRVTTDGSEDIKNFLQVLKAAA